MKDTSITLNDFKCGDGRKWSEVPRAEVCYGEFDSTLNYYNNVLRTFITFFFSTFLHFTDFAVVDFCR